MNCICGCGKFIPPHEGIGRPKVYYSEKCRYRVRNIQRIPREARIEDTIITPNELKMLELLANGLTCKEISKKIHISKRVIEQHLFRVRSKILDQKHIHLSNTAHLLIYALKVGWLLLDNIELPNTHTMPSNSQILTATQNDSTKPDNAVSRDATTA